MKVLSAIRYKKISHSVTVDDFIKEIFRKSIHVCAAMIPFFASIMFTQTLVLLSFMICTYIVAEHCRTSGRAIPIITGITNFAARKRDEGKFILGPVTLAFGILLSLILFPLPVAKIGIYALAFGDGLASVAGKLFGKREIPFSKGKTFEGSFACFIAVFLSSWLSTHALLLSLEVAILAMAIEILPLKDYDNLCIPVLISLFVFIQP